MAVDKTILYLSYGPGPHVQEIIFSLLTAFHFLPPGSPGYRYIVYTDEPAPFAGLGVELRPITAEELTRWLGGGDYLHRRKILAVIDALERFGGRVLFVDSDTFFRRSPARLFDRIGPGRSCLHVCEAHLHTSKTELDGLLTAALAQGPILDQGGAPLPFTPHDPMWNSGVLGVDASALPTMREIPGVIDQFWARTRASHIEQYVTGVLLSAGTIAEARDTVFHYWAPYLKPAFRSRLPQVLASLETLQDQAKYRAAFAHRLRPTWAQWFKVRVREALRRCGLPVGGLLKSA